MVEGDQVRGHQGGVGRRDTRSRFRRLANPAGPLMSAVVSDPRARGQSLSGHRMSIRFATASSSIVMTLATMAALTVLADHAAARQTKAAPPPKEATAPRQAGEPIMAIVSIKSQQVTLYDAEGWILRAPVSTGTKERETPAGIFAVVEKKEDHRSNMYDDAHMPHMQRITWNGIALHGGPLPGYAASHGCVRMPFGFAEKLFDKTRIGMRVIIAPNDAAPVEFSHPALFAERGGARGGAGARRDARPRGRGGRQGGRRGEESRRDGDARGGSAHGSRCASWNRPRRAPTPSSRAPRRRSPPQRRTTPRRRPRSASRRPPPRPRKLRRSSTPPRPTRSRSPTPPP